MARINFNDAQQALGFLTPQLLRINTQIEMQEYPSFDYASLLPVNTDGGMWSYGSVFYSGDIAGSAEFLAHKGFDMPLADISTEQHVQTNHFAGIGYEYSRGELERAAELGRNLSTEKAEAARTVAESFIYGIAISGHAEKNLTGLINSPLVPTANVAADGTGGLTTFASKTPDQINRDINAVLNAPFNSTKETKRANRLLLPTTRLQYLAQTRIGDGSDTILKFVRENNAYTLETGQPLDIRGSRELETAGAGGTARMMAFAAERSVVQMHLPGPHEFLEPWRAHALLWQVPGIMNIGGVEFRRPKGAAYRDGI
ncbi:MAG: DUF2184 domain-containing protein [Planctomycetales bacterium]|nr:DUF2184 domain-containing protein [Planctomycetales bacterium]